MLTRSPSFFSILTNQVKKKRKIYHIYLSIYSLQNQLRIRTSIRSFKSINIIVLAFYLYPYAHRTPSLTAEPIDLKFEIYTPEGSSKRTPPCN